jgi:archaellum component FlaC
MNNSELYLINLKIEFWKERIKEISRDLIVLNSIGNQDKIDQALSNLLDYENIVKALESKIEALTNTI